MKTFLELLKEAKTFKVGDTINFHNDLKKLQLGKIIKVMGKEVNIEAKGVRFKRKMSEIYES